MLVVDDVNVDDEPFVVVVVVEFDDPPPPLDGVVVVVVVPDFNPFGPLTVRPVPSGMTQKLIEPDSIAFSST